MERQLKLAKEFLERIEAKFDEKYLSDYVKINLSEKDNLNTLLGLTAENDYTVTLPVLLDNDTVKAHYAFLNNVLSFVLHNADYKDIAYVKGTVVNPKGQTIKITRVIPKFQEQIIKHPNYSRACRELGITDDSFSSICPRIGEIANASHQELFITSSIAEFMMVNDNSSYTSCYRHGVFTDTSYWSGTLSYGVDKFTLLVGIRNKDTNYKTGRSWLWCFPEGKDSLDRDMGTPFMIQPKSYGEFTSIHRKAVRMYIQSKIMPDVTWKAGKKGNMSYEARYGYIDNYDLTVSWIKGEEKPEPRITFSSRLHCLYCGSTSDIESGDGLCWDCTEDSDYLSCVCCGDRVHEDDVYYARDNGPYCEHCYNDTFFYCEECSEDELREDAVEVRYSRNGREYTQLVCEHCISNSSRIHYCERCDTYYHDRHFNSIETVEGDFVCESCIVGSCDDCGSGLTEISATVEIGGYTYCENCAENHESEEEVEEDCEEAA